MEDTRSRNGGTGERGGGEGLFLNSMEKKVFHCNPSI